MTSEYWDKFRKNRSSRRRFLGAGVSLGAGAAGLALVGCGDDDDNGNGAPTQPPASDDSNGNGATPAPNGNGNGNGERFGGTVRYPLEGLSTGDPPTLYPFEDLTYLAQHPATLHYSRLLTEYAGPGLADDYTALEGDLADGMPEQIDDVTYIFKMRPNVMFHDKPPMDGRRATAEDFAETYQAFLAESTNAAVYESVVQSIEATDEETLQVTLLAPFAPFLATHASTPEGVWFIPVESIDGGQVHTSPVGTGPWVFDSHNPGVSMNWDRHPEYFRTDIPYFDRVEASMISDPQQLLAGLRSGQFDFSGLGGTVYNEAQQQLDPDGTNEFFGTGSYGAFYFNFDNDGGRWMDTRLRQALSMSMNRSGAEELLDQTGLGDWFSPFCATNLAPYYLSPQDPDFGENARFFQYDPEEARALMQAAVGSDTVQLRVTANVDRYGSGAQQSWEYWASQLSDVGWDIELVYQEYGSYITSTYFGDIEQGIGLGPLIGSPRDPNDILARNLASSSARHNWSGGPIDEMGRIDEMIAEQQGIMDLEERISYIHDMQREMAEYMLTVPYTASAGFAYANPWVQNFHWKNSYSIHLSTMSNAWFTPERIAEG